MKAVDLGRPAAGWPSGPPGDSLAEFAADRLGFLARAAREFGDFVPFRLGRRQMVLVNHHEWIEEALLSPITKDFSKDYLTELMPPLIRRHLLLKDPDSWLAERRLSQPAFHHDRVVRYATAMTVEADRMVAGWADGGRLDIAAAMRRMTLHILCRSLFDVDISSQSGDAAALIDLLLAQIDARVTRHGGRIVSLSAIPGDLKLLLRLRRLERELDRLISERSTEADHGDDLLTRLTKTVGPDGYLLSRARIRYVVVPLFFAGHETTAAALAWMVYLLALHPQAKAQVLEELDRVVGGRPARESDLPSLKYLGSVVNESLRLYPPIWGFGRQAIRPTQVGPYSVPEGTVLWMSQWVMHRDPRWFERPDDFIPERWNDGLASRLPRCVYFPFGAGSRRCLGGTFAAWEATLVLATVMPRFDLILDESAQIAPEASFTLRPREAMTMITRRRH
ncbi:MAG: cytochrome P450 [Candidatus Dormibacteraeota bacterium]|nr:cytochrome P450 [Candidatus Dormibacteraeota bacterium]MDQ6900249.1 cytochrome P450 [Candidatus Dormibacteraeota bacterium]